MIKNLVFDFLRYLFKPSFWLMIHPYSRTWDIKLNKLMDENKPEFGYLTCSLGDIEVWVGNYPYGYGFPYRPYEIKIRPKRRTIERLREIEVLSVGGYDTCLNCGHPNVKLKCPECGVYIR